MTEYNPAPSAHDIPAPGLLTPPLSTPDTSPQGISSACPPADGALPAGEPLHPAALTAVGGLKKKVTPTSPPSDARAASTSPQANAPLIGDGEPREHAEQHSGDYQKSDHQKSAPQNADHLRTAAMILALGALRAAGGKKADA